MDHEGLPVFATEPAETAAQCWDQWLKRFINFTVAKRITDDAQKKAMLLHYAGEEVFDLGESLGIIEETSFGDTKHVLTEYFALISEI